MEKMTAIDILKTAILLERKGKIFYSTIAKQTASVAVRKIFTMMAEEEDEHIKFLSDQFKNYQSTKSFAENLPINQVDDSDIVKILSEEIKKEISAASFEAAAISAAIDFENNAIKVYSERAEETTDINEKNMYQMLADWERTHHQLLYQLSEDLKESIWNDNNFWPF